MKKISTQILLIACSFMVLAGCSKQVKVPVNKVKVTAASTQTTSTQTTNGNQGGHTCGGDHSASNGNGY